MHTKSTRRPQENTHQEGHGTRFFLALQRSSNSRLRALYLLTTVSFIKRKVMERLILALGTREVVLHNEGSKEPRLAVARSTLA